VVCPRGVVALLLVALVLVLTPAAYADPPDPTWIGGYWDDDDFDTVVVFIASAFAIHVPIEASAEPLWIPIDCLEPAPATCTPSLLDRASCPRAPPAEHPRLAG
jgi:hypothetical protein